MSLTNAKRLATSLTNIVEMERDPVEYWRSNCLKYWRLYLNNHGLVRHLRHQNRILRRFLTDITPQDLASEIPDGSKPIDPTLN